MTKINLLHIHWSYVVNMLNQKGRVYMELIQDPRCYTDICIDGKWFHHDHCTDTAYMLWGGTSPHIQLDKTPKTESELIDLLTHANRR